MRIALIGNPNCGKTTLFNELTGANRSVGNWSGVTVGLDVGHFSFQEEIFQIVDLPGIYSLSTPTPEQAVVQDFLSNNKVDIILNVVNCMNLERHLFLSTQLLEMGIPMVMALNMADALPVLGLHIDEKRLSALLGVPCLKISAAKRQGLNAVLLSLCKQSKKTLVASGKLYLEGYASESAARYAWVAALTAKSLQREDAQPPKVLLLDKIFCHPILGISIFILLMLLIFCLSFGPPSQLITGIVEDLLGYHIAPGLNLFLYRIGVQPWLRSLILDGAFAGVSSILVFLPQLAILFFCLAILESSGYMARAAFIMDKQLSGFGLSGLSAIPLLLGCGCSVPGILACRIMDDPTQRRLTMLILPFMSCSARMPVYALLTSTFFPDNAWIIIAGLYLLGLFIALFVARILSRKREKKQGVWLLELPPYQPPIWRMVLRSLSTRCWDFLSRAATAVLAASMILWLLGNFDGRLHSVGEISHSILAEIGQWSAPFFTPMGCGYWQIAVALCTGLLAKEMIVASMAVVGINSIALSSMLSLPAAMALLVFCLLYTPCIATLNTAYKENGSLSFPAKMAVLQLSIAWCSACLVYQFAGILGI